MHRHTSAICLLQRVDIFSLAVAKILTNDFDLALELDLRASGAPLSCGYWITVAGCWIMCEDEGAAEQHESAEDSVADRSGKTRP